MRCPLCHSTSTMERSDRTAHGYRRFRCGECKRGFNERTGSVLNRLPLPTDVIFLIVLWRLRLKLSRRELAEIPLLRVSHEAVREWEAKLAPLLTDALRQRRRGKIDRSWYVDETHYDEVRDFLRPAARRKQHVPAARRRAIHVQRVAALRDMLAAA